MTPPFKPLRDDGRARWRVIFDMALRAAPGETITYAAIEAELGVKDRSMIYRAVATANRHLWAGELRSLDVVPDVGYRLLLPAEHEQQAVGFQRQSRRKLDFALQVAQATDLTGLPTEKARQRILQYTAGLVLMARAVDRHERQLKRHEDLIAELGERLSKVEQGDKGGE